GAAPILARRYAGHVERLRLSAPFVGHLILLDDLGRYFRTLSTLLDGGTPLARAMPLARQTLSHLSLQNEFEAVEGAVRTGEPLGAALVKKSRVPRELLSFIEIGEETGELGRMAGEAASIAETKVRTTVRNAMVLLAPVLTAVMGLLTAGVIAAVMSGVLSLNEAIY
ncbi:MAG TPA: type II secretion system F family protein, partial [Parvularculaceae bacterium]|nr:type II secretion system F family protein [Parvularculaceae bacterium]